MHKDGGIKCLPTSEELAMECKPLPEERPTEGKSLKANRCLKNGRERESMGGKPLPEERPAERESIEGEPLPEERPVEGKRWEANRCLKNGDGSPNRLPRKREGAGSHETPRQQSGRIKWPPPKAGAQTRDRQSR